MLAIFTGVILVFAFPPFGAGFAAWVAFVPLLLAVDGEPPGRSFVLALVSGFVFFLGTVYWVVNSMYHYGGMGLGASVPVMLLLVCYLSVYFGLFGLFFRSIRWAPPMGLVLLVPALWVSLEYLRSHLFTGFPWILLGYSQVPYLPLVQISDVTGVWGISYLVMAVNTSLYLYAKRLRGGTGPRPVKEAAVALVMVAASVAYGYARIGEVDAKTASWKPIDVAVAQGNIDQGVKWDASYQKATLDIYRELTVEAGKRGSELIVWPETAVPFYLEEDGKRQLVSGIVREGGGYLLTGSPAYDYNIDTGKIDFFNSAYLLGPPGRVIGRYDKVHLVPYGEYVPLKRFFPFIKKLTAGVGDFSSGPGPMPMDFEHGAIGTIICFEAIFPELSRGAVMKGATVLINITNDAWFGKSAAPYQHFGMAVLRAVENRVFLLRAANTGISAVVDPAGRVRHKTRLFEKDLLTDTIGLKGGLVTIYTRYGDVFAYLCMAFSGAFILIGFIIPPRAGD